VRFYACAARTDRVKRFCLEVFDLLVRAAYLFARQRSKAAGEKSSSSLHPEVCLKTFRRRPFLVSGKISSILRESSRIEEHKGEQLEKLAYKVKTFCQLAELSDRFVKQEIYDGNLFAVKTGNQWRTPVDEARRYLGIKEKAQDQDQSLATAA
jgi:hypothetical protein